MTRAIPVVRLLVAFSLCVPSLVRAQGTLPPTKLPFDCREASKAPKDPAGQQEWTGRCGRISDVARTTRIGEGPGVAAFARDFPTSPGTVQYWGGFVDHAARKLYVGGTWSDNRAVNGDPALKYFGNVFEVDIDWSKPTAGNRRVVSGKYLSNDGDVDVGKGDKLSTVKMVKRGPDGFLYAFAQNSGNPAAIVRIDPKTGDRTTVWRELAVNFDAKNPGNDPSKPNYLPPSQCENGKTVGKDGVTNGGRRSLQVVFAGLSFEMHPKTGDFFMGVIKADNNSPDGIIRISADGRKCSWVTRYRAAGSNKYADNETNKALPGYGEPDGVGPRGTGMANTTLAPLNLFFREVNGEEWIYASAGSTYYRINVATGNRQQVLQGTPGDTYSVWDPARKFLWTSGTGNGSGIAPVLIDDARPTIGGNLFCTSPSADWFKCIRGSGSKGPMNRGGLFLDPADGNLLFAHDTLGLVRLEVATGNSYTFSM